MERSEYAQLVAIARRQGRPLEDIGAAWREANTAVHGNPVAPETLERLTRETKTGRLLSSGVPFREALRRAGAERNPTGERFRVANVSPHDPRWQVWDSELGRYVGQRRFERKEAAQYARMLNKREAAFPVGRNPRRNPEPDTRANPRAESTDWGLVGLAAAGLGYLWWRQKHGASSPAPVSGTSASAAVGPMQLPRTPALIPYQAWWVKYVNGGQAAPFSTQFPDTLVYDTPTGGMVGLPIPPPLVASA